MSKNSLVPLNNLAITSAPTIPTLVAGDMYYNTSNSTLFVYNGSAWVAAGGSAGVTDAQSYGYSMMIGGM